MKSRLSLLLLFALCLAPLLRLKAEPAAPAAAGPAAAATEETTAQPNAASANKLPNLLIISSYNPDTNRMSDFIDELSRTLVAEGHPYNLYIETLDVRNINDSQQWLRQMDLLLDRYQHEKIRFIILLGQEAWSAFVSLGRIPEDVLCLGNFASVNGILLPPPEEPDLLWQPESVNFLRLFKSVKNVGGNLNLYDIGRNVDLIRSLYPNVRTIGFVSDNTYGGISLQSRVRKIFQEQYPDLELVLIDSREGEETARARYASLPAQSAVLLGTWRVGQHGEYFMQNSLNTLVAQNPHIPVFTITRTGLGTNAIGGYIPAYGNSTQALAKQILEASSSQSSHVGSFSTTPNVYEFDSRKLEEWKIAEYALPRGSIIRDSTQEKLLKYSQYITYLVIGLSVLALLMIQLVILLLTRRKLLRKLRNNEKKLIVAREKAEESDRLKSAFLANMSHEIRTPMNAIVGFSTLLQDEGCTHEERVEYSNIVVSNSEILLTLLNDILDISSLECGKIRFNYSVEPINELCQRVLMTTAHTRKAGVEARYEGPKEEFSMMTDSHRLSQVLINLLTNAAKFTEKGCITVKCDVRPLEKLVYFSVSDNGIGIPPDKREMVFNRFEKLEGNHKNGTGLGLAICKQIVTIFGGRIWVDPDYTEGARFVFTHPIGIVPPHYEQGDLAGSTPHKI